MILIVGSRRAAFLVLIKIPEGQAGVIIIKKLTKNELILEDNGNRISLTRFVSDEGNIERLTFGYDDFPEGYTGEYNLPGCGVSLGKWFIS